MTPELKISRAIVKLCNERPFFGSVALLVPVKEDNSRPTMSTDGRSIGWNREFVEELTEDHTQAILCHEVMHIVWLHSARLNGRNHTKFNIASDFAINQTLVDDGLTFPEGALLNKKYSNMSAEQIYPLIEDQYEECPWGQVLPLLNDDGSAMSDAEKADVRDKIKRITISAAETAKAAGKGLPGGIRQLIRNIRKPQVNWRTHLRTLLQMKSPEEQSWSRPNRRYLQDDLYLPSSICNRLGPIAIVIDTSASVSKAEREVFLAELDAINKELKPEELHVLCIDEDVTDCYTFTPEDDITSLDMTGYGGTDMAPAFHYVSQNLPEVETLLCFSDCEFGHIWPRKPLIDVLWLTTQETNAPYGRVLKVEF